jgi:hypothetical protein
VVSIEAAGVQEVKSEPPKFDLIATVLTLLFRNVPRRRRFLVVGTARVPEATIDAARVLLSCIGLTAGSCWPTRAVRYVRVLDGCAVDEVVRNLAKSVEQDISAAHLVPSAFRPWLVASQDAPIAKGRPGMWAPLSKIHLYGNGYYSAGASIGISRGGTSDEHVKAWLQGIANVWAKASEEGLAIDRRAPTHEWWVECVEEFFALCEQDKPFSEPPSTWDTIEQLWRFETYRITLLELGGLDWREPEDAKQRGILY